MGDVFTTTRETTVTIKESTKQDAAWFVFRGRPVEIIEDIVDTFALDRAGVTGLALVDVAILGRKALQSGGLVAVELGGKPVPAASSTGETPAAGGPPWDTSDQAAPAEATPSQAEPVDPDVAHLAKIEGFTAVDDLKLYWAENNAAFAGNERLTAAYKAKGKALQAAAK